MAAWRAWRPQIDQGTNLPTTLTQFLRVVKASIKQSSSSTSLLIYFNVFTIMELLDIRGVHVVLVSLFGQPNIQLIFHFFGWLKENCPVSETGAFIENW